MQCTYEINSEDYLFFLNGLTLDLYKVPKGKRSIFIKEYEKREKELYEQIDLKRLGRLTLCISGCCNLACKYCYEGEQAGVSENFMMNEDTMKKTIDFIFNFYPEGVECVQFFGGEPLLNANLIRPTIEYIEEICKKRKLKKPYFTIVTNGTLISESIHKLFNEKFNRITISLDGRKEINDANRRFRSNINKSVYDTVVKNIIYTNIDRKYCIDIQMTVTEEHLRNPEKNVPDYLSLKKLGVDSIHLTPLIYTGQYSAEEREKYTDKLIHYFEQCYEIELRTLKYSKYYKLLGQINTLRYKMVSDHYCGAGFNDLSVDISGNIFPCFMFNGNNKFIMGNVIGNTSEFVDKRREYLNNTVNANEKCNKCWAKKICYSGHSGCIGAFYLENGAINFPVKENCRITKACYDLVLRKIAEKSDE